MTLNQTIRKQFSVWPPSFFSARHDFYHNQLEAKLAPAWLLIRLAKYCLTHFFGCTKKSLSCILKGLSSAVQVIWRSFNFVTTFRKYLDALFCSKSWSKSVKMHFFEALGTIIKANVQPRPGRQASKWAWILPPFLFTDLRSVHWSWYKSWRTTLENTLKTVF
jgi:hypothetical protein